MGMRYRLDAVADMRGDVALHVVNDAIRTDGGRITKAVIVSLVAWKQATRAARVAGSLGESVAHGVDIGPYFETKVNDYRVARDELPEPIEAA